MNKEAFEEIKEILRTGDKNDVRALFQFDSKTELRILLFKFNTWVRYFYPDVFKSKDAPFHRNIDTYNFQTYRGELISFVDIVFRDGSKTTRTKFFVAFCIANDKEKSKKLIKFLAKDISNAKQNVTDIYNILIQKKHTMFYEEIFAKTNAKRQESMNVFMTSTGIKVESGSVGTDQRGDQAFSDDSINRPDLIIFDDFETRKTIRSATETKSIWDNMEEARTGLAHRGGCIYLCNYITESGNVHKLVNKYKKREDAKVLIVPIKDDKGNIAWDRYTKNEVEQKLDDAEDPDGEYMCNPVAGFDVFIDREKLNAQIIRQPINIVSGFKMFHDYKPSHRYAAGHDIAGGVGLDSCASVFIDLSTVPAKVVATYHSNIISPEEFGYEIIGEASYFGNPLVAPERNYGTEAILVLKQKYKGDIYKSISKATGVNDIDRMDYGWHTNRLTKGEMFQSFKKAVNDGLLELTDEDLINEAKSYTRNDLMNNVGDPRLVTNHYDLLTAACIAWSVRNDATAKEIETVQTKEEIENEISNESLDNYFNSEEGGIGV